MGFRKRSNKDFDSAIPTNGRTQSTTNSEWFGLCIGLLSLLRGKSSERPGAGKGARFVCGGGKSFPGLKRFCAADPSMRRSARVKSKVECCICFLPLRFLDGATFGAVVALSRTRVCVAKRILDSATTAHTIKVQSEGEECSPPTTFYLRLTALRPPSIRTLIGLLGPVHVRILR